MSHFIGSLDQGTSSTRFIVFSDTAKPLITQQREHTQHYPSPGLVEHDPEEIWLSTTAVIEDAVAQLGQLVHSSGNVNLSSIIPAIGITNQRETTVVWNRHTGKAYHNAIVWSDSRTANICESLSAGYGIDRFRVKTGLPIAPYFSGTKLMYLLDTVPGLRADAENGDALFGTIDSYLIWRLTGRKSHVTDVTNASRTLLMNLHTLQWDQELLDIFRVPRAMLPTILPSTGLFGVVETIECLRGTKITGVLGDQQAALFGQTCFNEGDTKATYGTGCFILMNTGEQIVPSAYGLITTVAYQCSFPGSTEPQKPAYALEGSVAYSGALIQWLRDNLKMIDSATESEYVALQVENSGGVYFVPAFSGLFAPHWRSDARGLIVGLTAYHNKSHIVRAALEASAFQAKEVLEAMVNDFGRPFRKLNVDGGMTANNLMMQFQSDILGIPVICPAVRETTALGAALAAGIGIGHWRTIEDVRSVWSAAIEWTSSMSADDRLDKFTHWKKAVSRTLNWLNKEDLFHSGDSKPVVQVNGDDLLTRTRFSRTTELIACIGVGCLIGLLLSHKK